MNAPLPPASRPTALLFATDLSSRCDRALDRALIIARQWQARLVALTVVEAGDLDLPTRAAPAQARAEALRRAEQRLRADLDVDDLPLTTRVGQGPVTDAILDACEAESAGLIVTGVARNEALSRVVLGSSVDALARRSPVPLLVVRNRARAPYREVVVTSDFSAASRHALETAVALFPEAGFTLFHAFGNPYPAIAGMDLAKARNDGRAIAEREAADFLRGCAIPAAVRERFRLMVAHGDASVLLHTHGTTRPQDLVVLGTQRRRGLVGLLIGSVAERILERAENDVMVVPPRVEGGKTGG